MTSYKHLHVPCSGDLAFLTLRRGKVNALDRALVGELHAALDALLADPAVRAIVLTGAGKFFSFGLDVPRLFPLSREEFGAFLHEFTGLYAKIFSASKPVIAAVNGHAIAGGCMLAIGCDARLMVSGNAKIALNEASFGSSVFAGSVAILTALVGARWAERILLPGALFDAEAALAMGLVDRVVAGEALREAAIAEARRLLEADAAAYAAQKRLVRAPVSERIEALEASSIEAFLDLWYAPGTREHLKRIEIRD